MTARKRKRSRKHPNSYRAIRERTGFSIGYISRVLNGKRNPRFATIKKLAEGMHISIDRLAKMIDENSATGVPVEVSRRISEGMKRASGSGRAA